MAVRTRRQNLVRVIVMAVIVAMRMLVLHPLMRVFVAVRLCQMQPHTQHHQHAARRHTHVPLRSPSAMAKAAINGAKAKTEPVRAAPKARCASR